VRNTIQALLSLTLVVLAPGTISWACQCVLQAPCSTSRYGDTDFVGEVLSRREVSRDFNSKSYGVMFQVRVLERFRGTAKVGDIVGVSTGFGGGDCGYEFKLGDKYLIDASKTGDVFETSTCSLTAPLEGSEVELRSLRRIALGQRIPDLVGVLMLRPATKGYKSLTPLQGVPVEAKNTADGNTQKTVTDALGSFSWEQLPKGKYALIFGLPKNLVVVDADSEFPAGNRAPPILIESSDAASTACHVRIVVEPGGSIRGIILSR